MNHRVVVGVDGSPPSLAAVDLAAREARLRNAPLHLVYAYIWPYVDVPVGTSAVSRLGADLRSDAERIAREAAHRARAAAPTLTVTSEAVNGAPTATLLEQSRTASLVVVGDRGLGGFTGLVLGSVAVQLAAHAACPVLIARGHADAAGDVLLGVDGSSASEPAVGFAFEEAALRGVALTALHAWTAPVRAEPGDVLPMVYDAAIVEAEEDRVLAEALAGWRDKYPDVPVRRRLVRGPTRRALIGATRDAQLVVVGSRGRGGFTGLLLGSVSQAVLHHANCPVAIVPDTRAAARSS
ncbi:universal stress protein [Planosporangium sp. 12N6]|uniref:universal stress protein n=1 Tax=Planosporangium spinosum TaxID=3402278 RepID=UPI003CF8A4A3